MENRHDWSVTCRSCIAGVLQVEDGQIGQIEALEISILDASFSAVGPCFPRKLWGINNKFQLFVLWLFGGDDPGQWYEGQLSTCKENL